MEYQKPFSINAAVRSLILILVVIAAAKGQAQEHTVNPKARQQPAYLTGDELRTVNLYRDVLPAVVTIFTTRPVFKPQDLQQ